MPTRAGAAIFATAGIAKVEAAVETTKQLLARMNARRDIDIRIALDVVPD
jgi:hypothetical protein